MYTNNEMEEEIKMLSININGLNSPTKIKETLTKLQRLDMDIVCLQEVHIKKQYENLLEHPKIGKLYVVLAQQKKRGIAIYIKEWLKPKQIYAEEEGRILMMEIVTNQK